ncbi:MAG: SRPBCC family protein [Pseudomonadota bacterium]
MEVINVHERALQAGAAEAAALIDAIASEHDCIWPRAFWPAVRLDRPLGVGAAGGHGPIGYVVEEYRPGQLVKFRFTIPRGFGGHHWLELLPAPGNGTLIRHTIRMRLSGSAWLSWPLVIRPLHDALLEDAMALAQASMGDAPVVRRWSWWVKLLRWAMSGGRARGQRAPEAIFEVPSLPT